MDGLSQIPSDRLLAELSLLARRGRAVEAELLAFIGEVDSRRLFLREGCASMFRYCVEVLHFSEAAAFKRIAAARAGRKFPDLLAVGLFAHANPVRTPAFWADNGGVVVVIGSSSLSGSFPAIAAIAGGVGAPTDGQLTNTV